MKVLFIISAFTSISAIRVPSVWQPQPNTNADLNNVNQNNGPLRQEEIRVQTGPSYNPFLHNVPNPATNGIISNGNVFANLPVAYNNWFTGDSPNNNGLAFITPTSQISNGNLFQNNINTLTNNNEVRKKPYIQQRQIPPRLVQSQRNFNRRPVTLTAQGSGSNKKAPVQVPYITYTTHGPGSQSTSFSTLQPIQHSAQSVNIKQSYPQVTSPKTVLPLTELDFSPRNPFPSSQEDEQASTQVNRHNGIFSTSQPINTFDFSLNNPFPHGSFDVTRFPQGAINHITRPLQTIQGSLRPNYNPPATNLKFNPFTKNYRDHRTHEPTGFDPHYDREAVPIVERLESEKAPIIQNHERPAEVPTRPIYPGEGHWAKPGVKHRPFISQQKYANLEESNPKPDGYDTFLEGQQLFENQKRQFGPKFSSDANNPTQQSTSEENSDESEIFVPTRLYAQVRHSEDEKHLPPESDENGRLKELVKDTKIQTIYSEEGFEDSAYDHAGHEKKAENIENSESEEKKEEAKEKNRTPVKKYNVQSASYSIGDQNLEDNDIEEIKKEELKLEDEDEENEDSEPAGTHYEEQSYLNKIRPTKTKAGAKNGYIKSKEIKTVTAMDKGGGNIEMEIMSEVKAVVQPNNSTKFHKYVKIYPKKYKKVPSNSKTENGNNVDSEKRTLRLNEHEIFIEEVINQTNSDNSAEYAPTTVPPTEYSEIITMEIPTTTQATTSIPKLETKSDNTVLKNTKKTAIKMKLRRRRRSTPGLPKIEIDTDFIDEINHNIGQPTEKPNRESESKYPFYKNYEEKGLHENSPLRYSEDLKNAPVKTDGKLAFYNLADKKMACPDVNPEVDPVPDKIKNADDGVDEEEDEEDDPATKTPRLGKLGDKIDCFKSKYFGEDPLDNPFFQEELVGPIKPIFSEIDNISPKETASDSISKRSNSKRNTAQSYSKLNKANEQLHSAASSYENEIDGGPHKYGLTSWFPGRNFGLGENTERDSKFVNHFVEQNPNPKVNMEPKSKNYIDVKGKNSKDVKEVHTIPPATLITTPKYTIKLKPKHIYDQIELLEYLPEEELDEVRKQINANFPKVNISEVTTPLPKPSKTEPPLSKKKKKSRKRNGGRKAKVLTNNAESMKMETSDNRKPESLPEADPLHLIRPKPKKPLYEIFDINKYLPKVPKIQFPTRENIFSTANPKYLAPVSIINPTYEIFDVNKFLPTTPFPLFKDFITHSTVLPKYKVISEVFYKEDIKPNEQLNVLQDVINNIKNFPKLRDTFPDSSEQKIVKLNAEQDAEEFPQNIFQEGNIKNKDYFSSTVTTIKTTFSPKMYASNHKYFQEDDAEKQDEDMLSEYKTSKKPKRRRRIKTTTQETPLVIEESTSTVQYISEPAGLMPPLIRGYKTIYHPKRDNSQHVSSPSVRIEERKINRYFVQGMRPPPKQKVYLYSDFVTDNHISGRVGKPKRSTFTRRRSKRSAQRPSYANLSRSRNKQAEEEPEVKKAEEEDDYVPHRSKNYHYDEKTGRIVYDKKPEESTEEGEVEYIEIVEETPKTTAKPKQNPIFATATPPPEGQSYTDFVKLLKSASNYHEIPDPTTTEKGAEEATQKMVASTLDPVSTSAPEFLSILAKVRNDSNYKPIEDKKKTTTTQQPIEIEEAESSEEESQVDDIKNSPGGQGYDTTGTHLEIFDISDFLPNIKSYLPKTSIDTSKYTTIERPQSRHSISSRYNSEENKDLRDGNSNKQRILPNSEKIQDDESSQSEHIVKNQTSTTTSPEVTTQKIVRSPSRRRTTTTITPATVTTENNASTTQSIPTEEPAAHHDKARRNYRRRPTRIKIKPTTESNAEIEADSTTKIVHRRSERDSNMYAEGNEQYEHIIESDAVISAPLIKMEDYGDYEEVTDNVNSTNAKKIDTIELVAKKMIDIFKNYNKDQKHGGNYKKEDEVIKNNLQAPVVESEVHQDTINRSVEVLKAYGKTKKHGGNYKAEKDVLKPRQEAKQIVAKQDLNEPKKVIIFKDYDKNKRHGGNYLAENEDIVNEEDERGLKQNESIQIENVNVFQDYDKTKKHGGNYRSENDTLEAQKADVGSENPTLLKNVEVFKDYDKTKKHGGNYKAEDNPQEQQLGESQIGTPHFGQNVLTSGVEVFKNYDKTKKHGGNYISENDSIEKLTSREHKEPLNKAKDTETFKNYNKEQKTGGNYKSEDELNEPNADETKTKRYIENRSGVQRLADVVLKPEAFYSDLKLPLDINDLKIVKNLSTEELEEIAESAEGGDDDSIKEKVVTIGNKVNIFPEVAKPESSTKKPFFIKDPSKRLYFYAPVR